MSSRLFVTFLIAAAFGTSVFAASEPSPTAKSNNTQNASLIRDEKLEGFLTTLENRCKKMLITQIAVQKGIKDRHKTIEGTTDKTPRFEDYQAALNLADSVKQTIKEVNKITEILKKDPAVAFPEVFKQLRDDMRTLQIRLEKCDVGPATQTLAEDIVETLREMTEPFR